MISIKTKDANFGGRNNKPQPLSGWRLREDCSRLLSFAVLPVAAVVRVDNPSC